MNNQIIQSKKLKKLKMNNAVDIEEKNPISGTSDYRLTNANKKLFEKL